MIKKIASLLCVSIVLLSGCASFLNGKYQQVKVLTGSSNATVYVDGKQAGKGSVVMAKVERNNEVRQFKVETPGYKPEYTIAFQKRKSPLYIMSWIPFGILFLMPPIYDQGPKSKDFDKEFTIKPSVKIASKGPKEKYVYLKKTAFEVKKEDLTFENYSHRRYVKSKKSRNVSTGNEKLDIANSIFSDAINDILKKNNFIDTTGSVFRNTGNSMYLGAKVSKIKFKNVSSPNRVIKGYVYTYDTYVVTEITTEWNLLDIYDQPKYSKTIVSQSGQFASNYDFQKKEFDKTALFESISDALSSSFYEFLSDQSARALLNVEDAKKLTLEPLDISSKSQPVVSLKSAQAATVTVVTKNGHGSGCLISDQGYVVTNYHVVAGSTDQVDIVLSTGEKLKASLVRKNEDVDLALLQVQNLPGVASFFKLPPAQNFETGDEVFAIGTPKSIELSQTLSKGIISAVRTVPNGTKMIQTDVSVNAGNSGGALVSKDGKLLGIVNSKLFGQGVEGIAFCIPASEVSKALGLM